MREICPVGCGRGVNPGHLMCGNCWGEVPRPLKADVWRTWRAYQRFTGIQQSAERRHAREAYQQARDAAIGSVEPWTVPTSGRTS